MNKIITSLVAAALTAALLAGCSSADVVLKYSRQSFADILKSNPSLATVDRDNYDVLTVDRETALKISRNYSASEEDIILSTPLAPFTRAGLNPAKLSGTYKTDGTNLFLVTDFGKGTGAKTTPEQSLFESVAANRKALTYHQALDHFGIVLNGGKFEFAKDYKKNDKDIVFVINAKPLQDIGVDVHHVDGWVFKTMQDEAGKDVDLLLKPYDLK